jgi:hypothetical protein
MATNEGIHMTGGRIDAGALAVGSNARATNITTAEQALTDQGHTELAAQLAEVVRLLEAHAASLDNPDEVKEATDTIAAELTRPKPNRTTLAGLLTALAAGVSPVATLATAVDALARTALALF